MADDIAAASGITVHAWSSFEIRDAYPERDGTAAEIVQRLRLKPLPDGRPELGKFALSVQQMARHYFPHNAALQSAFGNLSQQVGKSGCCIALCLPKEALYLAVRLVMRAARVGGIHLYFEEAGFYMAKIPFAPVGRAIPEVMHWLAECESFPALSDARKRAAGLLEERFAPHGFSCRKGDYDAIVLSRLTPGHIEHSISFHFSMHLGFRYLSMHIEAISHELKQVVDASWLNIFPRQSIHWHRLFDQEFEGMRIPLMVWDDFVDVMGSLERVVLPVLQPLDSLKAMDAWYDSTEFSTRSQLPWIGYERRLATARFTANPDYEALKSTALMSVDGRDTGDADHLRKIIAWLDTIPAGTLPLGDGNPDALPYETSDLVARAQHLLKKSLGAIGFKKKAESPTEFVYERKMGEISQHVAVEFMHSGRQWMCRMSIYCPDKMLAKINDCRPGRTFGSSLFVTLSWLHDEISPTFSTWSGLEWLLQQYQLKVSQILEGIDSLQAVRDVYYLESSPRYQPAIFARNAVVAYGLAAILGGPEEAGIMSRAYTQVMLEESEKTQPHEKGVLKKAAKSIKKILGKTPAIAVGR